MAAWVVTKTICRSPPCSPFLATDPPSFPLTLLATSCQSWCLLYHTPKHPNHALHRERDNAGVPLIERHSSRTSVELALIISEREAAVCDLSLRYIGLQYLARCTTIPTASRLDQNTFFTSSRPLNLCKGFVVAYIQLPP